MRLSDQTTRWLGRATALLIVVAAIKWGGLWAILAVFALAFGTHVWHRVRHGRWMDPW